MKDDPIQIMVEHLWKEYLNSPRIGKLLEAFIENQHPMKDICRTCTAPSSVRYRCAENCGATEMLRAFVAQSYVRLN